MIIGITGKAGAGKDTIGLWFMYTQGYAMRAFATRLKRGLHAMFGLDPEDYKTLAQKEAIIPWIGRSYRDLAQTLGTEWGRGCIHQNIWVKAFEEGLRQEGLLGHNVAVTDVRFQNEAEWVRENGVLIHVLRGAAPKVRAHSSENGVATESSDIIVRNDGSIAELHAYLGKVFDCERVAA